MELTLPEIESLQKTLADIHEGEFAPDSRDARYWLEDLIEALKEVEDLRREVKRLNDLVYDMETS